MTLRYSSYGSHLDHRVHLALSILLCTLVPTAARALPVALATAAGEAAPALVASITQRDTTNATIPTTATTTSSAPSPTSSSGSGLSGTDVTSIAIGLGIIVAAAILIPVVRRLTLPLRQRLGYARINPNVPTWREIEKVWHGSAYKKNMVRVNGELRAVDRRQPLEPGMQFLYVAKWTGPAEDMQEFYNGRTWYVYVSDNNGGGGGG